MYTKCDIRCVIFYFIKFFLMCWFVCLFTYCFDWCQINLTINKELVCSTKGQHKELCYSSAFLLNISKRIRSTENVIMFLCNKILKQIRTPKIENFSGSST